MVNTFILEGRIEDYQMIDETYLSIILEVENDKSDRRVSTIELLLNRNLAEVFREEFDYGDIICCQGHIEGSKLIGYQFITEKITLGMGEN